MPGRVALPTYPFAREEYWIDSAAPARQAPRTASGNGRQIEDIINQVDDATLAAEEAVRRLKKLV
jgi:hypothetical protein